MQGCNSKIGYRQMWMVLRKKYLMTVKRLVDILIHYIVCWPTSPGCYKALLLYCGRTHGFCQFASDSCNNKDYDSDF